MQRTRNSSHRLGVRAPPPASGGNVRTERERELADMTPPTPTHTPTHCFVAASPPPRPAPSYASSNVFWPGEQDAGGTVYTCTYCPMVTLVNETRLIAIGGCTPSGCSGCNGIHLSSPDAGRAGAGSACSAGCIKHSDDGGRSWSKIRAVVPLPAMRAAI